MIVIVVSLYCFTPNVYCVVVSVRTERTCWWESIAPSQILWSPVEGQDLAGPYSILTPLGVGLRRRYLPETCVYFDLDIMVFFSLGGLGEEFWELFHVEFAEIARQTVCQGKICVPGKENPAQGCPSS